MRLVLFLRLPRGQGTDLMSGNIVVTPVQELIGVASGLSDSLAYPGKYRSQGSARFFPGQYVEDPEAVDDPSTVPYLIEFRVQFPQLALWIPDCFNVSFVILNLGAKDLIHGSSIREIVGFQHV